MKKSIAILCLIFFIHAFFPVSGSVISLKDPKGDVEINGDTVVQSENVSSYVDLTALVITEFNSSHYRFSVEVAGDLEHFRSSDYLNFSYFRIYFFANVQWDCFIDSCKSISNNIDLYFDGVNHSASVKDNQEKFLVEYSVDGGNLTTFFPTSDTWRDVLEKRINGGSYEVGVETRMEFAVPLTSYENRVQMVLLDSLPDSEYFLTRQTGQDTGAFYIIGIPMAFGLIIALQKRHFSKKSTSGN